MSANKKRKIDDGEVDAATIQQTTKLEKHKKDNLYRAIVRKSWDECRILLRSWSSAFSSSSDDDDDALYRACVFGAPLDVLRSLLSRSPRSVRRRNALGLTPLHVACCGIVSPDAVELLLAAAPDVADAPDRDGYTPLHYAATYAGSSPVVVERLLRARPDAVSARCENGDTPLDKFARKWRRLFADAPRERTIDDPERVKRFERTLTLLLEAWAKEKESKTGTATTTTTTTTMREERRPFLVLHEAIRAVPEILVRVLLKNRVIGTRCARPDAKGNFPLHVACALTFSKWTNDEVS